MSNLDEKKDQRESDVQLPKVTEATESSSEQITESLISRIKRKLMLVVSAVSCWEVGSHSYEVLQESVNGQDYGLTPEFVMGSVAAGIALVLFAKFIKYANPPLPKEPEGYVPFITGTVVGGLTSAAGMAMMIRANDLVHIENANPNNLITVADYALGGLATTVGVYGIVGGTVTKIRQLVGNLPKQLDDDGFPILETPPTAE